MILGEEEKKTINIEKGKCWLFLIYRLPQESNI